MRVAPVVELTLEQCATLEARARARRAPARSVERARIILLAAEGWQNVEIAARLRMTPAKVARWRARFLTHGLAALERDAPRHGRPRTITAAQVREVVRKTTQDPPVVPANSDLSDKVRVCPSSADSDQLPCSPRSSRPLRSHSAAARPFSSRASRFVINSLSFSVP
jgi:hypothetical protein